MIKITLDGFLLTPVQKICKYPLQLNELLKYTKPVHADHRRLKDAFQMMRETALDINEKKRQVENVQKMADWQRTIADWEVIKLHLLKFIDFFKIPQNISQACVHLAMLYSS